MTPDEQRVARVVCHVVRSALADMNADRIALAETGGPEVTLLRRWCAIAGIGLADDGVAAHPANRTALLLDGVPAAALLPLGDVPASAVASWTSGWTGSDALRRLAADAGGIAVLDGALARWLDRRYEFEEAFAEVPQPVGVAVRARFDALRFAHRRAGMVPKLGHRTIGHDLRF